MQTTHSPVISLAEVRQTRLETSFEENEACPFGVMEQMLYAYYHVTNKELAILKARSKSTPDPKAVQQRAMSFISARIAEADANQWHGGYIHGLIQAFLMAGTITVKQGCQLEEEQERASCQALNRHAVKSAPKHAVGGVA